MMNIKIEINEERLKELILDELQRLFGDILLEKNDVQIMVKSKQNYKSEWEIANYKATIDKVIP